MRECLLVIMGIFFCIVTHAQEVEMNPEWQNKGDIVYAAYVGLTTSSITANDFGSNNNPSGNSYLIGLQADYFFMNNWSLKTKLNFEDRNYGSGGSNYLNLTIAPVWHFGKNRRWHLHLGGAYSANINNSLGDGSFETDLGIGVIIPTKSVRFFIELDGVTDNNAIEINLTDINGNLIGTTNLRTNRTSLNFGILF